MKQANPEEIKEYLENSRTRKNLYCTNCLDLKRGHVMGKKVKMVMVKPYVKEGKSYAWRLICLRCNSEEILGY